MQTLFKPMLFTAILSACTFASARELGSSVGTSSAGAAASSSASPQISDPNQSSRISVKGTLKSPTGLDSVILANSVVDDASQIELVKRAKKNAALTTQYRDHNVSVTGCKLLKHDVNASCYGTGKFAGGPTLIGRMRPLQVTAAYPDRNQQGNILVIRDPSSGIARAVTITDIGPSRQNQFGPHHRAIDLSVGAFKSFGNPTCDGEIKDIEIYQCPMKK